MKVSLNKPATTCENKSNRGSHKKKELQFNAPGRKKQFVVPAGALSLFTLLL